MKKSLILTAVIVAFTAVVLSPTISPAQVYRTSAPYCSPPLHLDINRVPLISGWVTPWSLYKAPSPALIRKWAEYRRWLDFQQTIRSPLNPENPIDYLLRTF
jgi:hypothetical protein